MKHELGVEQARIALQRTLVDRLASYPDDDEVLKKIAMQYTGPVRFSGEHILSVNLKEAPREQKDLVDYWAVCEIARGDRLLSDFFRRHSSNPVCENTNVRTFGSTLSVRCMDHEEELELEHRSLIAL